jgi:hypothetical protein
VKDKHQEEWKKKYSFLVAETLAKPLPSKGEIIFYARYSEMIIHSGYLHLGYSRDHPQ